MEDGPTVCGYNDEIVTAKGSSSDLIIIQNIDECGITDDASSSAYSSDGECNVSQKLYDEERLNCDSASSGFSCRVDMPLSKEVGKIVYDATEKGSVAGFIASRIENQCEDAAFMACNLKPVVTQFHQWQKELPMVEPFYAVKCNPDPAIVRLLGSLGCGFDCATMGEMDLVINGLGKRLSLGGRGLSGQRIVYANPAKMVNMIQFALDNGVRMTVFDGEDELRKIAALPGADKFDLLLRLTTDDRSSVCQFSEKFGCPVADAPKLLEVAKELGLNVAGVSFHVGSGCGDANAYTTALEHSRIVFETALSLGMPPMSIVDIGGGFPGDTGGYGGPNMPTFSDLAAAVREGIRIFGERLNRPLEEVRFIAEPGRYFVSASTVLATKVYSRRGGSENYQALYVDDGVYGSFNNIVYDHYVPVPKRLDLKTDQSSDDDRNTDVIPTAVFGPTCDGLDQMCQLNNTTLTRCALGDWLIWENMGAYTHTASYVFNGYSHIPTKLHCMV
mmetsp:Transcript_26189/g.26432  ORF Transcript_26189/g.26432 Transcript_26189/m.26432 type:complete len:503 (+) Transcript_26189:64-1572(+)